MQTVQAANVLTIASCLATETLCVGAVLYRQIFLVEDDVTIDIRNRYFSRRNQIEIIHLAVVHLTFLVGQLTCTITRSLVHYRWRHDLCIASLTSLIEEEVNQRALQTGSLADIDGEAGTRNLHTEVKVDEIIFLGEFPVGQGISDTQRGINIPVAYCIGICTLLKI